MTVDLKIEKINISTIIYIFCIIREKSNCWMVGLDTGGEKCSKQQYRGKLQFKRYIER